MLHRQDTIQRVATDLDLQPGQAYTITAYRPGGILAADAVPGPQVGIFQITSNPTLYPGHGFRVNDRLLVGIDPALYSIVGLVDGNTITILGDLGLVAGDTVVNLGVDSGQGGPAYDGSDVTIYSKPSTTTPITQSRVTANEEGEYDYYHTGTEQLWELVRGTDGVPVAFVVGAYERPVNAENLEVADLTVTGNETVGGTLGVVGATALGSLAVAAASTLSGAVTCEAALTVGTTLGVTGASTLGGAVGCSAALTVGTTLNVTGASTLTGAVGCGAVTSTGNVTSGGHIQGLLQTQAFTANDTIAHSGRTVVDITNTSGANTLVVAAPSSVDGKILILRVKAITGGSFVIADSGNCSLSAAWDSTVGATVGSTLTLIASGSVWYEVARSKNT